MDYHQGDDLLSGLPLSIIHIILSLVPIRDAVRTSLLSRQWRYTWATLPWLFFEDEFLTSSTKIIPILRKRMISFITNALSHHQGPIHQFNISVSFFIRSPDIDEWILCLSRNIKELTLCMGYYERPNFLQVPSSIYSCEKLTQLELWNCDLDPPPSTFKGFLFLRRLSLSDVHFSRTVIESLVANAPLLETFELFRESGNEELIINAPNLKFLILKGDHIDLCVYAPLLVGMVIKLYMDNFLSNPERQKSSFCNYANFMGGFPNLETLTGSHYFTKYLSKGIESYHHTLVFHRLKDIELEAVDFKDIKSISVVVRLIVGAPNLQKLEISIDETHGDYDVSEAPNQSSRDFGFPPNCTFEKLRVVKMSSFYGHPLEMEFIKFLLECSQALETVNVSMLSDLTEEKKQNVTAKLMGFGQTSTNAKLSITLPLNR